MQPSPQPFQNTGPELLAQLRERGYVVVPSYLSREDLEVVRTDFEGLRQSEPAGGTELSSQLPFDHPHLQPLRAKLGPLIEAATPPGARPLWPLTAGNYIRSSQVRYGLHCDFGFLSPSRDAVKLWIPIEKVDPRRDGMTFVRMDRFREREPRLARSIAGRGALAIKNGRELVIVGRARETVQLGQDVGDLCETPEVRVGDVVVFRAQDTFHCSQELEPGEQPRPERIAWAVPIRIADEQVRCRELFGNPARRDYVGREQAATVLACCLRHRREVITYDELDRFQRELQARQWPSLALFVGASLVEPLLWR